MKRLEFRNCVSGFLNDGSETKDSNRFGGNDVNHQNILSLDEDDKLVIPFRYRRSRVRNRKTFFRRKNTMSAFNKFLVKDDAQHKKFIDYRQIINKYFGLINCNYALKSQTTPTIVITDVKYRNNECLTNTNRHAIKCGCISHHHVVSYGFILNRPFHYHPMRTIDDLGSSIPHIHDYQPFSLEIVTKGESADVNCSFQRMCPIEMCFIALESYEVPYIFYDSQLSFRQDLRPAFSLHGSNRYAIQTVNNRHSSELFKSPGVVIHSLNVAQKSIDNIFKFRHESGKILLGLTDMLNSLNDQTDCPNLISQIKTIDENMCLSDCDYHGFECDKPRNLFGDIYPSASLINSCFGSQINIMESDGCLNGNHGGLSNVQFPARYCRQLLFVPEAIRIFMLKNQFSKYGSILNASLVFLECIWKLGYEYLHGNRCNSKFIKWAGRAIDLIDSFPDPQVFSYGGYCVRIGKYSSKLLHVFPTLIYLFVFPRMSSSQIRRIMGGFSKIQIVVLDNKHQLSEDLINIGHFYVYKKLFSATRLTNSSLFIC